MKIYYRYVMFLTLGFLFFAPKAHASIAFVNATLTAVNTVSATVNVSSTNLLVVSCFSTNSFFASVSDTASNTFNLVGKVSNSNSGYITTFDAIQALATTTDTITCPFTGNSPSIGVNQYSGIAQTNPLDIIVTSSAGFAGSITSPSFTTAQASEVAYYVTYVSGGNLTNCTATDTALNTYTNRGYTPSSESNCDGDSIYSSIATNNQITLQNGGNGEYWATLYVTFKAAASVGTLSCVVTSTCVSPSVGVLYLASTTNSHAALASSSGYTNIVCCSGVGSLGNSCNGVGATSTFLHLASSTNSHVEENTQNNYPSSSYACLSVGTGGSVSVGYVTSTSCEVAGYNTELVSMASTTNSHVASPGSSTFQAGSTIQVCASAVTPPPIISNVVLDRGSSTITLTPNATTSVSLSYTVTDYNTNGCSDIFTHGTVTSTAFLDTVSSTCESNPTGNNLSCYVATSAGTTNSCGGSTSTSANATDTLYIYYLARSSGVPSSSYPNDHWYGFVGVKTQAGVTATATSSAVDIGALSAINVNVSSINFGTVNPNTDTGSVNQSVIISNVGNSSNTPQLSGTTFVKGASSFVTSSEHYATLPFTFGGSEQQMNSSPTTIPGLILTAPTSIGNNPSSTIYFGLGVPLYTASGTYTATDTFTGIFSN